MSANRRIIVLGFAALLICIAFLLSVRRSEQPRIIEPPAPPEPLTIKPSPVRKHIAKLPVEREDEAPPPNAADVYRRAFALCEALSKEQKQALANWKTDVDPAFATELCARIAPITSLACQAVTLTNCDWGTGSVTVESPLPYVTQSRLLARAMFWNAVHCRPDDPVGVADDIEAALRVGDSVSEHLIGQMVNTAIEVQAMALVAERASRLTDKALMRLAALFDDHRYEESLYRAFAGEAELAHRSVADTVREMRDTIQQHSEADQKQVAQIIQLHQQFTEWEREYVQTTGLSDHEYQAWQEKWRAVQQTNPLIASVLPVLESAMDKARATVVQRALISAGLALLLSEPNALQSHLDPASGNAFTYRPTADGFELQSTYLRNGEPVVVFFPGR